MAQVRVHNFSVSLDGFGTGEGQSLEATFGHAGGRLMEWFFATRTFHAMHDTSGGDIGVDEAFASNWWGDNPGFHTPVFVLTHYPRPSIELDGGTTFHFIDASPAEALVAAREAAGGLDVRIGGGPSTIRQFLAADLIDHIHIAVVPILLGRGEPLWTGLEGIEQRFHVESVSSPSGVTHLTPNR